ncbi:unnamed protein product [Pseudo-nitzschia multistriata]|uniref:Peptidase M16 N-terminal domain-containing protein n=1 Tax=Pseudo-nitzschia multistriata TaxID=183589 RepID=A0A448YYU4_9STRA|nr:unnamed protein product [Pseudo-nitzschia multistriata]
MSKHSTMRLMVFFLFVSASQSFVAIRPAVVGSKNAISFLRSKTSCSMLTKGGDRYCSSPSLRRSSLPSFSKSNSRAKSHTDVHRTRSHSPSLRTTARSAKAETLIAEAQNATNKEELLSTSRKTEILAADTDFVKPERDMSEYRWIKLENNLQVLLVSTASDKANGGGNNSGAKVEAASVHVQAGHFDDTIAGLAHFHEHMLFLGTKKYPGEDEYEGFLSKHGGFCNAYTDMEDTNYYFSVTSQQVDTNETSEGLKGGLDRLAQFFIHPTFDPDMVERELRAIDSEYRNGKTSDSWRNYQLLKSLSNQKHPFSNFGCGNYETLSSLGSPVQELKNFWKKYYTTSNMRLSVVGCSSLDALQKTVEETFGELALSDEPPRREKVNPLSPIFPRENAVHDPENPAFGPEQIGKQDRIAYFLI